MAEAITYTLISSTDITNNTWTLTSIPNTYTDLRLVITGKAQSGTTWNGITFNNNTASDYWQFMIYGGATGMDTGAYTAYPHLAWSAFGSWNTTYTGNLQVDIFNYAGSTSQKPYMMVFTNDINTSNSVNEMASWAGVLTNQSAAISSIQGTSFPFSEAKVSLYGILRG